MTKHFKSFIKKFDGKDSKSIFNIPCSVNNLFNTNDTWSSIFYDFACLL